MRRPDLKARLRLGLFVFIALLLIEITEYVVGTQMQSGSWPFLAFLAVIGAWPIVNYFMHIMHLWRPEE